MREKVYQVKLQDGSFYVPSDARQDDPRNTYIYSRFVADMFAREMNGTVVEVVTR